jgi:peptidoglycan/xylan/chitin deacetylase (PgdA/CDA1 family)/trans-aconitate methyltransferase
MEPVAKLGMAAYCAGLLLGRGGDPDAVLNLIADLRPMVSDPETVGATLAAAIPLGRAMLVTDWPSFEPEVWSGVDAVLDRFQEIVAVPYFARRARKSFERAILEGLPGDAALLRLGDVQRYDLELSEPLTDVALEPGVQRLICRVLDGGEALDTIEIAVAGPVAFGWHLADVVAAQLCWPLLGRFLEREVQPTLAPEAVAVAVADGDIVRLRRGAVTLGTVAAGEVGDPGARHSAGGWTLLLQETFARPGLSGPEFYAEGATVPEDAGEARALVPGAAVEIAQPLPVVPIDVDTVEVRCGGATLGRVALRPGGPRTPQALRSAIVAQTGFELCVVVVREALVGGGTGTLRERLAAAAAAAAATPGPPAAVRIGSAPGPPAGGPLARRAVLPAARAEGAAEVAAADHRPVQRGDGAVVVVDPGLLAPADAEPVQRRHGGRDAARLDPLFARAPRPWADDSDFERLRDEHTLALAPPSAQRTLELGCDGGRLTALLAQRSEQVDARDPSAIAVAEAQRRCAHLPNVSLIRHAPFADALAGPYDLVVCRDVLALAPTDEGLRHALTELARTLQPDGSLIVVHALVPADGGPADGTIPDIAQRFGAQAVAAELRNGPLRREAVVQTPAYRVERWRRASGRLDALRLRLPRRPTVESLSDDVPPAVAELLRDRAAAPTMHAVPEPAAGVPVLAYHRVAADGADFTAEWRLHPDRFEAQLAFLRDQGYTGVRATDLAGALLARRELPGRPILLTFDDAYADFPEHAWPLLRKYGFSATVFAVTDCTGAYNAWDAHRGETLALLSWETLRRLQEQGAEIGSHTAAHPPLTALSPDEVVDDLLRSRAAMARELGAPPLALAYPFGDQDAVVSRLAGACGFQIAFTCEARTTRIHDSLLTVPRIEVTGRDDVAKLAEKLRRAAM